MFIFFYCLTSLRCRFLFSVNFEFNKPKNQNIFTLRFFSLQYKIFTRVLCENHISTFQSSTSQLAGWIVLLMIGVDNFLPLIIQTDKPLLRIILTSSFYVISDAAASQKRKIFRRNPDICEGNSPLVSPLFQL